jgi:precorrin-2 dehydrogenase/sirohydrochlorin ferrochelatase
MMASTPTPYPANLLLAGQPVLVVGGGPVAARKVTTLLQAGARVTVIAPAAARAIADQPEVTWLRRRYQSPEAGSYRLVVTATNDPAVNTQVARDCEAANVFVNSADDPANCTFTLPSVARRGHLQVTVSTDGRSPALARWLRRRIEREIDSGHAKLLELLAETRSEAKSAFGTSELPGWEAALDSGLLELVRVGRVDEARSLLRRHLGLDTLEATPPESLAS